MSIGDFSRLSGLSPKRLRSYAARGLLPPAGIDPETGYRYYAADQLRAAQTIDALRQAGIPLAEIETLIRRRGADRVDHWVGRIHADAARKQEALATARRLLGCDAARPADEHRPHERSRAMRLEVAGRSETGFVRADNEDSIVAQPDLVAVADGLGGHPGGRTASELTAALLAAAFTGSSADELTAAVRAANWAVWRRGSDDPELAGMGSTVCAVGVVGDAALAVVNVGDSRAYLFRQGELRRLTDDHTVAAELLRDGRLTETEAGEHPHRRLLTRAVGVGPQVQIDSSRVDVGAGDAVLVCSDGLFKDVADDELAAALQSREDLQEAVDSIVELALCRGGDDNVSAVVAQVRP